MSSDSEHDEHGDDHDEDHGDDDHDEDHGDEIMTITEMTVMTITEMRMIMQDMRTVKKHIHQIGITVYHLTMISL